MAKDKKARGLFKGIGMNRKTRKEFGLTIPQLIKNARQLKRDGLITGDKEDRNDDAHIIVGACLAVHGDDMRVHAEEVGIDWDSFLERLIQLIELLMPFFLMFL